MNIFRELWRNKTLVWKLGKNDFKTKYAGSYFGSFMGLCTAYGYNFDLQFLFSSLDFALWIRQTDIRMRCG